MNEKLPFELGADDFARRFSLRAPNLMWLLGAGASASAGIPTATDMIWEFKQQLFLSQRRVSLQVVADLSSPLVREQLQAHIEALKKFPPAGAPDEYAALFEAVYPAEVDRQAYIDAKIAGAKPSYGHLALATLMRAGLLRLVWTTNFDPLVADACAKVYEGTGALTVVTLDAPDLAAQRLADGRWPVEVKLHGDFRSRRLKNTADELRHQVERLRQILVESSRRFGLVVVGYSGRDDSVMNALCEAVDTGSAFPNGLFWLHRGEHPPLERVQELLRKAAARGVEASVVWIDNFDELMRDLLRLAKGIDAKALEVFATERRRWTPAPVPEGSQGWPTVRLNALPVVEAPSVCRRVLCQIGGTSEARKAVREAQVDVLVARTRAGVLAYGSDAAVRSAFAPFGITGFDLHTIEAKRLRYESGERGLLRDALTRAIARERGLDTYRHRSVDLLAPSNPHDSAWMPLRRLVGTLSGTLEKFPSIRWREGLCTRLDWADGRLWLLIDPRTVFDGEMLGAKDALADFARERTVRRYNRQLNELTVFWARLLAGDERPLRACGVGDGVDAAFRLSSETAYSRRGGA